MDAHSHSQLICSLALLSVQEFSCKVLFYSLQLLINLSKVSSNVYKLHK